MRIHNIERIPRPEKVCISVASEFLLLISPASKKPRAGTIIITNPVETSIQAVSPEFSAMHFKKNWRS
jgi:hypothetical protein